MTQPLILLLPQLTLAQRHFFAAKATSHRVITREELGSSAPLDQIEILFGWDQEIGQQLLNSPTSQLRWIQAYSAGIDYLDLATLRQKNILVTNASGVHAIPITESVIGMLLSHYRKLGEALRLQTKKEWRSNLPSSELAGKKMLIVGSGQIGQRLAEVANFLGVTVFGINRSGHQLPHFQSVYPQREITKVIGKMDIVVNILPLTEETHHFYNEDLFTQMKDGVVFINVGRGPSVDTEALIRQCRSDKISFAGLDVFEEEPLSTTNPLWELDNVFITPHISGNTDQYKERILSIFSENYLSFQDDGNLVRNVVNLDLGY